MRRLSIIDINGGKQPIWNDAKTLCIVYNGELYNYKDLRAELREHGHVFRTNSDTEVVLRSYEQWGAQCLTRFNGMFAFAIWSIPDRELFVARDRLGEKPLYWYHNDDRIIFGSEIKAILADHTVRREIDNRALSNFLTFGHAVSPHTIYKGIQKLNAGHWLSFRNGVITVEPYWRIDESPRILGNGDVTEQILCLLDDAVRIRMVADVPLGAFLSGGIDSSAVVALMKRHSVHPVKTFSLGFDQDSRMELPDAQLVAKHLGTEHYELHIRDIDIESTLTTLCYHYDEPFGDAASIPVYLLSKFARNHVKVVLTGDGGDELFGGYTRYALDALTTLIQRLPRSLRQSAIPHICDALPPLRRHKYLLPILSTSNAAARSAAWLTKFDLPTLDDLLLPDVRSELASYDPTVSYIARYNELNGSAVLDHLNRWMYADVKTLLVDAYLEKTDKATMACSIEARVPLLDHRIAELAFQLPGQQKVRRTATKIPLRKAVRGLLPAASIAKPKRGFFVPTGRWLNKELRVFAQDVLLDNKTKSRGYFSSATVERILREHQSGQRVWTDQIWLLLNFELWHRIYLDNLSPKPGM